MNDQDLDWIVYHLLLEAPGLSLETLAGNTGCGMGEIEESIRRLEKAMLIVQEVDGCRALSIPEMLLHCQARYDRCSPITFEDGVIRVKNDQD